MFYKLIQVWICGGIDGQVSDCLWFQFSVTKHAIAIAGHQPLQRIADDAKVVQLAEDVLWLLAVGDCWIEVMDIAALAVDLESDGSSLVANFVEVAVILDPENQLFD